MFRIVAIYSIAVYFSVTDKRNIGVTQGDRLSVMLFSVAPEGVRRHRDGTNNNNSEIYS